MPTPRRRLVPILAPPHANTALAFARVALPCAIVALAGCGGGSSSVSPQRVSVATPPPAGPLAPSTAQLAFDAAAQTAQVTVGEKGYAGAVSVASGGCDGIATVTPSSASAPATFTVTAQAQGSCTLAFTDGFGQTTDVAVGVTITQGAIR